ncbi:hypothetical protein GGS23DRAFT_598573 [Durotheca rogersii]|uniref:uncharacterized protein n=1 Tax=Durotheca rogersii TaxID=419775 RepID=UPI0022202375|nr:uncharacterized protein GGS23DRAFT_598573 [Durotheca rogersii]KAI5861420.1 hypothetical protein GGS23DRAFT_598573 [Durotheca rogersii]
MVCTGRGVAGERAAVLAAQRQQAQRQAERAQRLRPALGSSHSSSGPRFPESPCASAGAGPAAAAATANPFLRAVAEPAAGTRRGQALLLDAETKLDMGLVPRGSFAFMSKAYVEEVDDWCRLQEERRSATF